MIQTAASRKKTVGRCEKNVLVPLETHNQKGFAQIMQRTIFSKSRSQYSMNGCCLPAVRKLYVTVDGNFHVCERISSFAPTIGNIETGILRYGEK